MSSTPAFVSADPALFNPQSGRLDASHIASDIQLPVSTIAMAIGKKAPSVRKHPDASSLQPELRRVYRIWVAIVELHAGNKKRARIFLNAPNKHLENQAPVEFIEKGDLKPLEGLVEAINARQPV
ncbi:Protein of unknown function [Granulicella rosea]|uniref:Uncharacterized protein n=1 Tax=Granulicella rosea TaxID=474952 RepID=A0A239HJG4_9BACT|nr:antitoxin Xre/MbcA/ParS toxin-binding domain-containing protein [Granulicella rosea]SNS81285.1 Protein of unknown function [Granulicella rosea]